MAFEDRHLAADCADDRAGARRFGSVQWAVIRRRLAVLQAAPTLAQLVGVPGRPHALTGDRMGQFALDLRGPYRLVFEPDHHPLPELATGGLDRAQVTRIRILAIEDYHD